MVTCVIVLKGPYQTSNLKGASVCTNFWDPGFGAESLVFNFYFKDLGHLSLKAKVRIVSELNQLQIS